MFDEGVKGICDLIIEFAGKSENYANFCTLIPEYPQLEPQPHQAKVESEAANMELSVMELFFSMRLSIPEGFVLTDGSEKRYNYVEAISNTRTCLQHMLAIVM